MAFQIDEKLMAPNRAIITRNLKKSDLYVQDVIKHKPGMMHYVDEETKLYLSIKPIILKGIYGEKEVKNFIEIKTEFSERESFSKLVSKSGRQESAMFGPLHIDVTGEAPLKVASSVLVPNLNVDMLNGARASVLATASTIVQRDNEMNIAVKNKVKFAESFIESTASTFEFKDKENSMKNILCKQVLIQDGSIVTKGLGTSIQGSIKWDGRKWTVGELNKEYEILTSRILGDLTVSGTRIIAQVTEPTNITNDDTFWFELA